MKVTGNDPLDGTELRESEEAIENLKRIRAQHGNRDEQPSSDLHPSAVLREDALPFFPEDAMSKGFGLPNHRFPFRSRLSEPFSQTRCASRKYREGPHAKPVQRGSHAPHPIVLVLLKRGEISLRGSYRCQLYIALEEIRMEVAHQVLAPRQEYPTEVFQASPCQQTG